MESKADTQTIRKIQNTGISTFTISLPKPWIIKHELSAKDSLRIDWLPSGALRITPLETQIKSNKKVLIQVEKLPENSLHDHLMGAYISGADIINIRYSPQNKQKITIQIRKFLRSTRGFEILEEDDNEIKLMCIMNAGDLPLHASLNRMYLLLTSLIRDILSVFGGESKEFIEDATERESEVDALLYLIGRQARISLDSHLISKKLELSRTQLLEYSNLASALERMMDHAYNISQLVIKNPKITKNMIDMAPLEQMPIWQQSLKELMINIRTMDSNRIEKARRQLKESQQKLISHEQNLVVNHRQNEWMAFDLSLSESVRRLCAYARDFGEILLNMNVFNKFTSN